MTEALRAAAKSAEAEAQEARSRADKADAARDAAKRHAARAADDAVRAASERERQHLEEAVAAADAAGAARAGKLLESTLRLVATKDEQLQDARAKLDAATREVSEARATVRREISNARSRLEAERGKVLCGLEAIRRDLAREKENLDADREALALQRSELAVRTDEASEALRNYPTPADAQRAVSRLESALRPPTQPLAREIFPGNLPLTPPRRRVVEEDPRRKPMLPRGLSAIVGVASRRRAARAVADIGDRNRLRAALSVWTRRHSPRGVSFNLNV